MSDEVLLIIGTIVAPFIVGLIKRLGWRGEKAAMSAYIVSIAVAIVVLLTTGEMPIIDAPLTDPPAFFQALLVTASVVFSVATGIYKAFKDRLPGLESSAKLEEVGGGGAK